MADITMCEGTGCPMRDRCYRYTATPSEFRQSYFTDIPYDEFEETCEYKMNNFDDGCGHDQNERYYDN